MYKIYIIIGLIITTTLFILQSQAFVYLYNTEDGTNIEAFDCVYYKEKVFDQFVPFCRRVGRSSEIDRRSQTCAPNSEKHRFSDLRRKNISISELLRWSSSIEVADQYAAFLSGNLYQTDGIICECKTPSTFGKFCEYELYGYTSINEILNAQFQHKGKISNQYKDQLYGHILCYTTLECDSGLLCLDFRDICDGRQQCTDGWDEENCDKLEFNECDNDEYRCLNGMCIPQQFFLDGDYDCMDNTDEQVNDPIACGRQSASFRCDERLCNRDKFSCGNGYCIERIVRIPFQQTSSVMSCDTLREYLYQCELSRFQPLWTSKSGQCLPLIQYNIMLTEVTDYGSLSIEEKCLCKHRFRCSDEQPTCYLVKELYFGTPACTNYHDIYLYGTGKPVSSFKCTSTDQSGCIDLRNYIRDHEKTASSQSTVPYVHYCDTFWDASSKIDELSINCQQWVCSSNQYQCLTGQCISVSTICNEVWDCSDASDEHGLFAIDRLSDHNRRFLNLTTLRMKCITRYPEYQQPFHTICNRSVEYPCLLANVLDPTDINTNRPCIPLSKIGDNIIDCYGGLDERNIQTSCSNNISMQHFEFRCPDSKVLECIPYNLLCKKRCLGDEPICFYRRGILNGFCSKEEEFLCLDGTCKKNVRCNQRAECSHGEDEYWCDYFAASFTIRPNPSLVISRRLQLETFDDKIAFACNRGIAVRQLNNFVCLCPPSYYGIHCEFYSDRINFIIQLNRIQNKTLNLVALLFFNDQVIDEFDFRIYPSTKLQKHRFHLIYSRSDFYLKHKRNRYFSRDNIIYFHPYSIQFEAYELKEDESIQLIAIWNYPFYFDFLPSFRFSKILRFESFNNACLSNSCSINSTCYPILNTNTSFICQCKSGFYGKNCEYISNICISRCTPNSICRPTYRGIINGMDHPLCICPINRFGPTCHIDYNECHSQPCANNGACLSRYNPIGIHAYECQCTDYFYGDHCEYKKKLMEIHLLNITYHPLKLIIRYYDSYGPTYTFRPRIQQIYSSLPISFQYYNENVDKLSIVLLTIYEKYDNEPLYFLLAIQQNTTFINKTSSLENPCPAANSFRTIKNDPHIPTVFKYHRLCHSSNTSLSPKCFHDTNYLCICSTSNSRAECFSLPSDNCSKCLSNGRCVQDVTVNLAKEPEFLCICPRCYYGHVCEFSTLAFSFTLDSLIVQDLFKIRFVYLSIALLIFLIGLFNNICCFSTFKRRATRKVGTGNYLLIVSILSQGSILLLLLKITHILISSNNLLDNIESINIITCKTISYLLSISTRSTYWLLSLISIERLCLVIYPSATLLKKPKVAIWLSLITILIIFSMHIHEIFYYTIVKDSNNATLCAINFVQKHVLLYDRITVLFHSLGPFIIQILSISCLIVMTARSRQRTIRHRNSNFFSDHIIKQFKKQKELYLNPVVIIFSTLPQIIISFSLACTELSTSWKRYILLITYFLSFLPQMLSLILHILPSTLYNKEFHETMIYKLFIKRIFKLRHD
ncbi:unnamed protein product [Rotaria sordida]|uniref:Uncharacterized protein n=1 Tax=Rotaria sordida TaxID=392033 RepID=A0A819TP18_9BILA|nr:unnamed protein product [Rotaria sordida]